MANISNIEKLKLEKILGMDSGYVADFSNSSFQRFINESIKLDIYNTKFDKYGTSKANRLRALWEMESDIKVGKLNEDLLNYCVAQRTLENTLFRNLNQKLIDECLLIAQNLQGKKVKQAETIATIDDFLKKEVDEISISAITIDSTVIEILEKRVVEVKQCLKIGASLSVVFLCGSILEGLLLGIATKRSKEFNQSSVSPKDKTTEKVKQFHEWTLSNFIDVSYDIGFLGLDVKKYSHSLRDFRNYIHPYQQMSSGFNPDLHTAKISWQVLKAAIQDLYEKAR